MGREGTNRLTINFFLLKMYYQYMPVVLLCFTVAFLQVMHVCKAIYTSLDPNLAMII